LSNSINAKRIGVHSSQRGYDVWGCYLSPVADSYGKQGLAPTHHRVAMCRLATDGSHLIMVDDWEARQPGYTRTLQVLRHVQAELGKLPWWDEATAAGSEAAAPADGASCRDSRGSGDAVVAASSGSSSSSRSSSSSSSSQRGPTAGADATQGGEQQRVRVMLLCGADLLATMAAPGVWMEPAALLREHGVVCVDRDGTELEQLLSGSGGSNVLSENREAIIVVRDPVPNAISSTRVRAELEAGRSAAYLAPDAVLRYARQHELYAGGTGGGSCGGGP
jgi:nicotinamide mononucleotide adenylyltransferase